MHSKHSFRRAVALTALSLCAGRGLAVGPGGAPSAAALLPTRYHTGDDGNFWGELGRAETGYTWHKIAIQPSLNYRAFYTDSLFDYQTRTTQQDFVHYVSPQLLLSREFYPGVWEMVLSVGYTPTFVVQSFHGEQDRTYHLARIHLDGRRDEQSFSIDHTYNKSSEITSEVGFLLSQTAQNTVFNYTQPLSGKLNLSVSAYQRLTDTAVTAISSARSLRSWGGDGFVLYDWLPKVSGGLGAGVGYDQQSGRFGDFESLYERVMTRWHYAAAGKLEFSMDAGLQLGQGLSAGGRDASPTPVFQGSASYNPRYGTSFSLSVGRTSGLSVVQSGQSATENRVGFMARQRVYQSMFAALTGSYGQGTSGNALILGASPTSHYDSVTLGFQYTWQINDRLQWAGFYQYMRRDTDLPQNNYDNNQVGFVVNLSL